MNGVIHLYVFPRRTVGTSVKKVRNLNHRDSVFECQA